MKIEGISGVRRKIGICIENLVRCHRDVNRKITNQGRRKEYAKSKSEAKLKG